MVTPSAGVVVTVQFPFSDLSQSKLRPAVILADAGRGDWILCQVTSNAYADPNAGHIGHIYCAASAAHRGQSKPKTLWSIGATVIPGRTLTKIRKQERGHGPAIDRIVSLGAEPPSHGQTPAEWLASLPATGIVTPIRHPGHYIYNFPLTRRAKARSRQLPSVPYPTMSSLPFHPSKGPDR